MAKIIECISGIDGNGYQYMMGWRAPLWLDANGLRNGPAWALRLYHNKNRSELETFIWVRGVPRNGKTVAVFKDEIIAESEVPALLEKYGIPYVEVEDGKA